MQRLKTLEFEYARLKSLVAEHLLVIDGLKDFPAKKRSPMWCRAALCCLMSRGLSEKKACLYLGFCWRVATY